MPNRDQLLETAIDRLLECSLKERAGERGPQFAAFYKQQVEPAVAAAGAAGWTDRQIHGEADRRYGQWLIDNADK
ncbi:hypothetical protein ACWD3J_13975 [Streptomyces sp. NPDC002755]